MKFNTILAGDIVNITFEFLTCFLWQKNTYSKLKNKVRKYNKLIFKKNLSFFLETIKR